MKGKKLDKLGQSLDYVILLRLSLAILVGDVKKEQQLPIRQLAREEKIYNFQKSFAEQTGVDSEPLVDMFLVSLSQYYKNLFHSKES